MDKKKKTTAVEVRQRRERVRKLLARGASVDALAEQEGVSVRLIQYDIAAIRKSGADYLEKTPAMELAAEANSIYNELITEAWRTYHQAAVDAKPGPNGEEPKITQTQLSIRQGISQDKIRQARLAMDQLLVRIGVYRPAATTEINIINVFERMNEEQWAKLAPNLLEWLELHPEDLHAIVRWGRETGLLEDDVIEGEVRLLPEGDGNGKGKK